MKKIFQILIFGLIYTFVGCSSHVGIDKVSTEYIEYTNEGLPALSKGNRVFMDRNTLQKAITNSKLLNTKRKKAIWNSILNNTDFKKENILIYTFHENSICDYDEKFIKKDSEQVDIVFSMSNNPNALCRYSDINYYFAYKVSKSIQRVGVKAFKHDYVLVEMKE